MKVKKIQRRDYQIQACNNTIELIKKWAESWLLNMATWTWKTMTSALILKEYEEKIGNKRHIFIVPKNTILVNILRDYKSVFPDKKIWVWNTAQKDKEWDILITTFHSLSTQRVHDIFWEEDFGIFIFDEAHLSDNESCERIKRMYNFDFILNLTATPFLQSKTDNFLDKMAWGNLIYKLWLFEAISKWFLSKAKYQMYLDVQDKYSIQRILEASNRDEYNQEALSKFAQSSVRQKFIAKKLIEEWVLDRHDNFLVYWVTHNHLKKTIEIWKNLKILKEWEYAIILWSTSHERRKQYLSKFEKWELKYIFSVRTLTEGVDIHWVQAIINTAPTLSKVLFFQKLGRVLRLNEWKEYWFVYDFIFEVRQKTKVTEWLNEKLEEEELLKDKKKNKKQEKAEKQEDKDESIEIAKKIWFEMEFEQSIIELEEKENYIMSPEEMKEAYLKLFGNRRISKKEFKAAVLLPFWERDVVRHFEDFNNFMKFMWFEEILCTDKRDKMFHHYSDEEIIKILKDEIFNKPMRPKTSLEYSKIKERPFSFHNLRKRFWSFNKISKLCWYSLEQNVSKINWEKVIELYNMLYNWKRMNLDEYERQKRKPLHSNVILSIFWTWEQFQTNFVTE